MELIDGNAIAKQIIDELADEVAKIPPPQPCVTFIRVGENPASIAYVNKKQKVAGEIGIESRILELPESIGQSELLEHIDVLNADPTVHGILVQAPLPEQLCELTVFNRVHPDKDVDGFSHANLGRLCQDDPKGFVACTPAGIFELLKRSGVETEGRHVVVVGRSLIVGKPCALLFLRKSALGNATVTICHSRSRDLPAITRQADILIAAAGKPRFITADMVKSGSVIIDVGINRVPDKSKKSGYRLVGDVDFDAVSPLVAKITPVPGGVGPMTVAMLMRNTVKARLVDLEG